MSRKNIGLVAASVAAAAAIGLGGAALANAADDTGTSTSAAVAGNASADAPSDAPSDAPVNGRDGSALGQQSQDTPVTGDEAAKVSAAVTAQDSTVTVESVRKDPDGSYDVLGTKDGQKVMFDVSADLATVSQAQGGPGGGGGRGPGPGGAGDHGQAQGDSGEQPSGTSSSAPTASS